MANANRFTEFTHAELAAILGGLLLARDAWSNPLKPALATAEALIPELHEAVNARTLADLAAR